MVHNSDADNKVSSSLAIRKCEAIGDSHVYIRYSRIMLNTVFPRPSQLSPGELDESWTPVGAKQVDRRVDT
jgi:hypothetical protein